MKAIAKFCFAITAMFVADASAQQIGLSYDVFGIYATRDKDGNDDGVFGPGVGVNYLFTPRIGAGLDTYSDGIRLPYMLNASVIYRFVNSSMFTPYALAGFGRQWEHAAQWTGHFGGGAEYNLKIGQSVFLDGRWVLPEETSSYGVIRFGVRLRF
jgi:hypothetical protein